MNITPGRVLEDLQCLRLCVFREPRAITFHIATSYFPLWTVRKVKWSEIP